MPDSPRARRRDRVLNTSHHDKASLSYMDVKGVGPDFVRLGKGIEKVHERFRLHRWREPLASADPIDERLDLLPTQPRPRPGDAGQPLGHCARCLLPARASRQGQPQATLGRSVFRADLDQEFREESCTEPLQDSRR